MKNNCFKYNTTSPSLKNTINFGKFPYINSAISLSQKKKILSRFRVNDLYGTLKIRYHKRYNHLKVETHINKKLLNFFYSKFYNYPSFIKTKELPKREKTFLKFFRSFLKKKKYVNINKEVLEIGCYDGILLKELKKINFNVEGCEPSDGAKIAKRNGIKIIKDFFKPNNYHKKFDIVIARHVLEHLEKPYFFLKDITKVLKNDGYVIIEVPNASFYLKNGLLEVFSLQHLQYFTPESMKKLFESLNLEVCKYHQTPENLIFFGKRKNKIIKKYYKPTIDITNFLNKIQKNKKSILKVINRFENKNILFWGAGGFFIAAINLYNIKPGISKYIVDSDINKKNKFFLGTNLKIITPDKIKKFQVDLIIITSYYSNEIIDIISKNKINCSVLKIFPNISLINLKNIKT